MRAPEDVILQLIKSKFVPVLMYGLEVCPLWVSDRNSLDFVVNRFFMKLFCRMTTFGFGFGFGRMYITIFGRTFGFGRK